MKYYFKLFVLICLMNGNSSAIAQTYDTLTDPRDGQEYKTMSIDSTTWMAENLNNKTSNSYCYDDNREFCSKFGRLYTWEAAMEACPEGWHLPSDGEWDVLIQNYGDGDNAGAKLKQEGISGFNAVLGGIRGGRLLDGEFIYYDMRGFYWSSSPSIEGRAWNRAFYNSSSSANRFSYSKEYALSVRCVQD